MALQGPQLDSLGPSVSTTTGVSQPATVSPGQSSDPSKAGSLAPTSSATPAILTGEASTRGQETLKMTKEALSGEKIIGGMDKVSQADVMGDIISKTEETNTQILKEVGTSEVGMALEATGASLTSAGGIVGLATSETGIGALVGVIIAAVGAIVGGIGKGISDGAKKFGERVSTELEKGVGALKKVAQREEMLKENGSVIDLALGEKGEEVGGLKQVNNAVVTEQNSVV